MYNEEDWLALSGIQHFTFCRRQWALMYIEQQWAENLRTVEGSILHETAHDAYRTEKRSDVIISRGMPVFSGVLGTRGVCDVVELHKNPNGIWIFGRDGLFLPVPVEYKRGRPKETDEDVMQLTAQAMCLEDMFLCAVPEGYLYYGQTNHRIRVLFDDAVRKKVTETFEEMHALYDRRYTPKVKIGKHCRACSLADICLPSLCRSKSAFRYIQSRLGEDSE